MGLVSFSNLKIKLMGTVVAISGIDLLKTFLNISAYQHDEIMSAHTPALDLRRFGCAVRIDGPAGFAQSREWRYCAPGGGALNRIG